MFISLSTAIFALATLVCWSHYGLEGVWYISRIIKKKRNTPISFGMLRNMYIILYCVAAAIGGILSGDIIWAFSDFAVGIMTCMNIAAVMKNRKEITLETKSYLNLATNIKQYSIIVKIYQLSAKIIRTVIIKFVKISVRIIIIR